MSLHFFYTLFPPGIGGLSAKLAYSLPLHYTHSLIYFFKRLCLFYDLGWAVPDPSVSPPYDLR